MIDLKIDSELEKMQAKLERIEPRQWPFVVSKALNNSAYQAREYLKSVIPRYVSGPVPYTISAVRYSKASKQVLESVIDWQRGAGRSVSGSRYLAPVVFGGTRGQKGFERALSAKGLIPIGYQVVPTPDAPLDQNGNIPRRVINDVLKAVDAVTPEATRRAYQGVLKRKGALGLITQGSRPPARSQRYFLVKLGTPGLPPGIYERRSFGKLGVGTRRIMAFVSVTHYSQRFPFIEVMTAKAKELFPTELDNAIDYAISTQR